MRKMGRWQKSEPMLARAQRFLAHERSGCPDRKVIDAHHPSRQAADSLRLRCDLQPFIEPATLIRLKVAKPDVSNCAWIDNPGNSFSQQWEHTTQSSVEQKRLIIFD